MGGHITQVRIGDRLVGIADLEEILRAVRDSGQTEPVRLTAELLRRARHGNYVPPGSERAYAEALYREYRRFIGAEVTDEGGVLEIRILGPGCPRCEELLRRVRDAAAELNLAADIQHVRDLATIASYGPLPTPVLVINGGVRSAGRLPRGEELKRLLSGKPSESTD